MLPQQIADNTTADIVGTHKLPPIATRCCKDQRCVRMWLSSRQSMCCSRRLPATSPRPNTNQAMVRAPPPKAFNTNTRPVGKAVRVNHVKVDKAEEAPDVILGTLPVNSVPAKVLFDTGASHSFISQLFAQMHEFFS